MSESSQKKIIALVKSALSGERVELTETVDVAKLYKFASRQNIVSLIYYGLVNCGFDGQNTEVEQFFISTCQYIVTAQQQDDYIQSIFREFDANKIDYLPLKGALLRELYPKPEIRAMGDADILIKVEQYDLIKPIMLRLGFTEDVESDHELVWYKDSVMIELHKRLIPSYNKDYYAYFGDGWDRAERQGDTTRFSFSPEDNFIYLLTHFAKHYRDAGIGIKHLVDLKLYLERFELQEDYLESQLLKLGLWDFYLNIKKTINAWFNDAEDDDATQMMTKVIFSGGAFGSVNAHRLSSVLKETKEGAKKSRSERFLGALFLPYKNMCLLFPVLKKAPVLLPVFWIWRVIYTAFNKKGVLTRHYNNIKSLTPDNITQYENDLNTVGLEYRFEEED